MRCNREVVKSSEISSVDLVLISLSWLISAYRILQERKEAPSLGDKLSYHHQLPVWRIGSTSGQPRGFLFNNNTTEL